MELQHISPRDGWEARVREAGCENPVYTAEDGSQQRDWREDTVLVLSAADKEAFYAATEAVSQAIYAAIGAAINNLGVMNALGFTPPLITAMQRSWAHGQRNLAMCFEWSMVNGVPKLLEVNASGLHGLVLAGRVQREWLKTKGITGATQWNALEDAMSNALGGLGVNHLTFSTLGDDQAMINEVNELMRLAPSNIETGHTPLEAITHRTQTRGFHNAEGGLMEGLFLQAPMSELIETEYGEHLMAEDLATRVFEPLWTLLIDHKGFLAYLYRENPKLPYLLATYLDTDTEGCASLGDTFAWKPFWGEDGANVEFHKEGQLVLRQEDPLAESQNAGVRQAYAPLPEFNGEHPLVGTWVIGGQPAGLSVRCGGPITDYYAPVVPHMVRA